MKRVLHLNRVRQSQFSDITRAYIQKFYDMMLLNIGVIEYQYFYFPKLYFLNAVISIII